jgi:putative glycerol-1-phosphate prenyltransferase
MNLLETISHNRRKGKKMFTVLVDPDRVRENECLELADRATAARADYFFVGSSIMTGDGFERCIQLLKRTGLPVIIFPGNTTQISSKADGILFLSLISGRNPEMLIGRHVQAAPVLKNSSLEIIPTGYMLIDSGSPTSVSYMSGTLPIPRDKDEIAVCTAIAGEMLGLKMIYLDAGSGARFPVSNSMVEAVNKNINVPLIAGGGIRTPEKAAELCQAGADMIVVGNVLEKEPALTGELSAAIHSFQAT